MALVRNKIESATNYYTSAAAVSAPAAPAIMMIHQSHHLLRQISKIFRKD